MGKIVKCSRGVGLAMVAGLVVGLLPAQPAVAQAPVPLDPLGEVGHGGAHVDVVPFLEPDLPQLAHVHGLVLLQVQEQEVAAPVLGLPLHHGPRQVELPRLFLRELFAILMLLYWLFLYHSLT